MDKQLVSLLVQLMQSDSDLSSLTSAAKNSLMMYLSGAYNPMLSSGMEPGGGQLAGRYLNNPNYPAVNEILAEIATGADKFQVGTKAKSLIQSGQVDDFDSYEFEGLADALYEESAKNSRGGQNDFWPKMLFRPEDVYSENNLPMGPSLLKYLQDFGSQEEAFTLDALKKRDEADKLSEDYKTKTPRKDYLINTQTPKVDLRNTKTPKVNLRDAKTPKVNLRNVQTPKVDLRNAQTPKVNLKEIALSERKKTTPVELESLKAKSIQAGYDAKEAEDIVRFENYLKDRFIKGYLGEAQKRGVTPLNDQLKQLTSFISKP